MPLHPAANGLILDYLKADGRGLETTGALFRAVGNRAGGQTKAITPDAIYQDRARVFSLSGLTEKRYDKLS